MMIKMFKLLLKNLRNITIRDFREEILSDIIVETILKHSPKNEPIKIIDYGTGAQAKLIFYVYNKLKNKYKVNAKINCYDFYNLKTLENLNKNSDIIFLHIDKLKDDNIKYDFCLINDVLHHIGVEKVEELKNLIINFQSKARFVFIKDHFQYGFFTNQTLRLMDFLGNYYNNVSTPKKYFNEKSFNDLLELSNSEIVEKKLNIKVYQSYFLFMSSPKLNFIYLIKQSLKKNFNN